MVPVIRETTSSLFVVPAMRQWVLIFSRNSICDSDSEVFASTTIFLGGLIACVLGAMGLSDYLQIQCSLN